MKIQESGENYLETILLLEKEKGNVRSIDIANRLDFSKASISRAMGILRDAGFLMVEDSGNLKLTDQGRKRAETIYERHCLIKEFFVKTLQVSEEIAEQDACRIEHIISEESFQQMRHCLEK